MIKLLSIALFALATISPESVAGELYHSCTSNTDCTVANSACYRYNRCLTGECSCISGYTVSYQNYTEGRGTNGVCVEDKKLGGTCDWAQDGCVGNLYCDRGDSAYSTGTCSCPYGTTADGDEWCTGSVALHGICGSDPDTAFDLGRGPGYSHWACKVYHDYYKNGFDQEAIVRYPVTERCALNDLNQDFRCTCQRDHEENSDNTTCQRKTFVAYNGECNNTNLCDPEVRGMFCDATASPNRCACGPNLSPRSYTVENGATKERCAHASAVFEIEEGQQCARGDSDPDRAQHKYCKWPLFCAACFNNVGNRFCLNRTSVEKMVMTTVVPTTKSVSAAAEFATGLTVLSISLFSTRFV